MKQDSVNICIYPFALPLFVLTGMERGLSLLIATAIIFVASGVRAQSNNQTVGLYLTLLTQYHSDLEYISLTEIYGYLRTEICF